MQPFQVLCIYIGVKEENEMLARRQLVDGATNRLQLPLYHFVIP
jgi:hypothetical protein